MSLKASCRWRGARLRTILILFIVLLIAPLAEAQTQLRFVTWRSEATRVWEQIIADFEAKHPGVKVVQEVGPHSSTEFHDLVTQKLRNRDPQMDVFFMDVIWPAEFAAAGWALPLDAFFSRRNEKDFSMHRFRPTAMTAQIYGVPMFVDAGMLYYRKDLLDKYDLPPPRTWPELVRQAQTRSGPGARSLPDRLLGAVQAIRRTGLQYDGVCHEQRRHAVERTAPAKHAR